MKMVVKSSLALFRLFCLTLTLCRLSHTGHPNEFQFETQLDKTIKSAYAYLEIESTSTLECAARCAKEQECMSASFNDYDGSCRLSAHDMNAPNNQEKIDDEPASRVLCKLGGHLSNDSVQSDDESTSEGVSEGSKVGKRCTTTIPCVDTNAFCSEATCFCHPMYVYNTSVAYCVQRCSVMEDSFDVYENTILSGFNDWVIQTNNTDGCVLGCLQNPECFHAEYNANLMRCYTGRVSYKIIEETKPGEIRHRENITLFSRKLHING